MSYQVIARRWRPQSFDQLVYQDHISRTLQNSIKSGRVSHAYIFTGPRGVGKTTTARILAKSLNCVNGPTPEPCGVCENCVEIKAGNSFDVIEIDGASNNGVDNIRELRETVHFAPVKSTYKIYIIDEVHMLSGGAFNALLKTLEEPPPHAVFMFATTEIHKVPDTILSRCQKFFFKKISPEAIVGHLKSIIEKEEKEISEKALYAISRAATGSMRDAQSLLEQVISFSGGDMSDEAVISLLGVVPSDSYSRLLASIKKDEAESIVSETEQLTETGINIGRYVEGFKEYLRAMRFVKHGVVIDNTLGFSADEVLLLKEAAEALSDDEISAFFSILTELSSSLYAAENEVVHLEMALFDMLRVAKQPSVSALIEKIESLSKKKTESSTRAQRPVERKHDEAPKIYPPKEAWSLLQARFKNESPYLFEKLISYTPYFKESSVVLEKKSGNQPLDIILDSSEVERIERVLATFTVKQFAIKIKSSAEEVVPPPDDAVGAGKTISETGDESYVHPTVSKVLDMFHGEIVKKGEQ